MTEMFRYGYDERGAHLGATHDDDFSRAVNGDVPVAFSYRHDFVCDSRQQFASVQFVF